jgi:hypothetical protein
MIGQRIEARPAPPWGAILFLFIALALLGLAAALANPHPAIGAALPLAVGLALLLTRPKPFAADLTAAGVELRDPPLALPYEAIEGLVVSGPPTRARAPLHVFHAGGVVTAPPCLNVPTSELYAFLASRLSEGGSREVPAPLVKFLRQQEELFGPERVFAYRARQHLTPYPRRRAATVCLAVAVTGLVWLAVGIAGGKGYEAWIGIGGLLAILFGLFALAFAFERRAPRIRNWRQSGLVISPVGLALVQGDMRGEMRWGELRKVDLRTKPHSFSVESGVPLTGIQLAVEGATIVIADFYDRPLPVIFDRIRAYWQGREANA